jgi:hypothetical protein
LLKFFAAGTFVRMPLPSKLTPTSAAIPAFRSCLPRLFLAMHYYATIF